MSDPKPYTLAEFLKDTSGDPEHYIGDASTGRLVATVKQVDHLRTALLSMRDVFDETETESRHGGPCWCPGWVSTKRFGHGSDCLQARKALGL